jgi:lipopolysaccharide/colanic/teichoic acid biosynthesis glycosyltransferase
MERFRSILEYERTRSIRSGQMLSLIVLDVSNSGVKVTAERHLGLALTGRIRSIDEAGWLDSQHIGVLLPYTSMTGARRLAEDICRSIETRSSPPQCIVYTYPLSWFFDNNGQSVQLNFQDISSQVTTMTSSDFSISAKYAEGRSFDFAAQCPQPGKGPQNDGASAAGPVQFSSCPLPAWKRTMDIMGALSGLIVSSPLMLLITIIIKIVSPGTIFFKQQRVGYMGKMFTMWKFRTMKVNTDATTHRQYLAKLINSAAHNDENSAKPMTKLENDPQIIPFGKILRQTYLDELPQLINVLRGEMSLIGPRPPLPYEVTEYLPWHKGRLDAVPGMTGLWQVSGKNKLTFNEMVYLDIQYWRKKSLWLDIKILLMTPVAILVQVKDSFRSKKYSGGIENG